MNPKYKKGLAPSTAARREAAQKIKTKQYKEGSKTAYKADLPGDEKPATEGSKYNEGEGAGRSEEHTSELQSH